MFHDSLFLPETLSLGMARKKWTAQTEVTDSLLRFREKRKWQLSYRRYVLEKMPCEGYARYFGLDIESLRKWFELQFTDGIAWDNFGKAWQFYHIVPIHHFDFSDEQDLALCWNYINIGIESLQPGLQEQRIDPFAVRQYFHTLHSKTNFSLCLKMLHKIDLIENRSIRFLSALPGFLADNQKKLETLLALSQEEFNRLNQGTTVEDILLEREILKKFGS